ncbi:MAG: Transcription antitermination protein NusB [Chlamydiia bacterium]|nr:Transcription antitermination protein NusB [Chlamydiia bacterium]
MAIPKQKFRECLFQLLYSRDLNPDQGDEIIGVIMRIVGVSRKELALVIERVEIIQKALGELDQLIDGYSDSFPLEKMSSVERNILRIAVFELVKDDGVPSKVAISEAIRLSKKFNSEASCQFVNALIDRIYQDELAKKGCVQAGV